MTTPPHPSLSPAQSSILDPAIRVVEAGPGSGKTRSLVARFIESASHAPHGTGVALLSFTNAAVDEVRRRTADSPELLNAPHFVGTIDTFLHRFIVTPAEVQRLGRVPSYRPSWDGLPADMKEIRIYQVKGMGVPLNRFRMNESGEVVLVEGDLPWPEQNYLNDVDKAGHRPQLLNRAQSIVRGLNAKGIYDANSARVAAFRILSGAGGDAIVERIARRFVEVLIDEAQDCDGAEFLIIRRLASLTRTLVVADPDQAIFGFRGGNPALFSDYWNGHAPAERTTLTTNYRSSKSICSAINALRAVGIGQTESFDESACEPVYILTGTREDQRKKFATILADASLLPADAMVLAHRRADAASFAGASADYDVAGGAGNQIAVYAGNLRRSGISATERLRAIQHLEELLLGLVAWPDEIRARTSEAQLETLGRTHEWLRLGVADLLRQLDNVSDRDSFGVVARKSIARLLAPLTFGHVSLSNRVKKPTEEAWLRYFASEEHPLRFDTIHGAKGAEFEAVAVCLPTSLPKRDGTDVLEDWAAATNSEPRRVLYVGVSRAKRVLVFAAGAHAARLESLLKATGTATEIR